MVLLTLPDKEKNEVDSMSVATEIVRFARSKIGTIVKYGKKPKGKSRGIGV